MYNFDKFKTVKILVVGDVMIDKYLWGDVRRISPEAPVPVVNLKTQTLIAGGAANVAANIAGMNAEPFLIGLIGKDSDGDAFAQVLKNSNISDSYLIRSEARQTIVKTRIMAHNQQIARLDQETVLDLTAEEEKKIISKLMPIFETINLIVVSDYGKGTLSETFMKRLIKLARKYDKPVFVDPKGKNYNKYKGATAITPNKFEIAEVCGCEPESQQELSSAGIELMRKLELESLIVTRGEDGILFFSKNKKPQALNSERRRVFDVTGAGDTFIAVLATARGAGNSLKVSAGIANAAAGLVVERLGTTALYFNDLKDFYNVKL